MKLKISVLLSLIFISQTGWSQMNVDSSRIIKVLTFNILHGATTKGDFDLDVIAGVIKEANPDFVALQEVDFKTKRARNYDLLMELGMRTKMMPLFAKAMNFDSGEYGNGILSKHTFFQSRDITLPYTTGNEPRVALEIKTVLASKDTIVIFATHLDQHKDETDRIAQVKKINEAVLSNKYPAILAGDLNSIPGSVPVNLLEELWSATYDKLKPEPTFPSDNPNIKIDYVMFYPKSRWKVLETKVIHNTLASDHCAYLVTLELLKD
jgi:endonuclease/exonuclease/phosphatase family metal-dependent hydrolase